MNDLNKAYDNFFNLLQLACLNEQEAESEQTTGLSLDNVTIKPSPRLLKAYNEILTLRTNRTMNTKKEKALQYVQGMKQCDEPCVSLLGNALDQHLGNLSVFSLAAINEPTDAEWLEYLNALLTGIEDTAAQMRKYLADNA